MQPTSPAPGQSLGLTTVANLRDLGGWPTPRGPVASGVLYRSAELSGLAGDDDRAAFEALAIRTVYDLRTEQERDNQPNVVPAGIERVVLDVLADSPSAGPAVVLEAFDDPTKADAVLGDGRALALFERAYREIVSLPSALAAYRRFFIDLADRDRRPALFHCTTGKDRTGWAAASTLLLLGVSDADVRTDYLLTNEQLTPAMQPFFDAFAARGGDPELLVPVLGVRDEYLDAAMAEVDARWSGIEGYFTEGLGLDAATLDAIRAALTVAG